MANTGIFEDFFEETGLMNEAVHYHTLCFLADYIHKRIEEDENGEPPDNDMILEALGLPDSYDAIIDEAYIFYHPKARQSGDWAFGTNSILVACAIGLHGCDSLCARCSSLQVGS